MWGMQGQRWGRGMGGGEVVQEGSSVSRDTVRPVSSSF